jgi:anti-sigma factor RsiW
MRAEPSVEVLSAYVDHELAGVARQELEAHLEDCETCRRRLAAMRQTVQAIHALPTEAPPRAFTIPAQREQPRRWGSLGAWASGLAAVAVVGLIVTVALHGPRPSPAASTGGGAALSVANAPAPKSAGAGGGGSAGVAALDQASRFAPLTTVSQTVKDPQDPGTTLTLTAQPEVPADGTLQIGIAATGRAARATLHLSLVRNGYGVALPWAAPPTQVSGSQTVVLSQLSLPSPRAGQYQLIAVIQLAGGDELVATVPVQLR